MESGGGERGRAGADEADGGDRRGQRRFEQDLVDSGDRRVPVGFVFNKVVPKLAGREFGGDDDGAAGEEGREEASLQSMDVEERHDEVGPVLGCELVRRDNVVCDSHHHVS